MRPAHKAVGAGPGESSRLLSVAAAAGMADPQWPAV